MFGSTGHCWGQFSLSISYLYTSWGQHTDCSLFQHLFWDVCIANSLGRCRVSPWEQSVGMPTACLRYQWITFQLKIHPFCLLCEKWRGTCKYISFASPRGKKIMHRGCWRDTEEGRVFSSCFCYRSLTRAPTELRFSPLVSPPVSPVLGPCRTRLPPVFVYYVPWLMLESGGSGRARSPGQHRPVPHHTEVLLLFGLPSLQGHAWQRPCKADHLESKPCPLSPTWLAPEAALTPATCRSMLPFRGSSFSASGSSSTQRHAASPGTKWTLRLGTSVWMTFPGALRGRFPASLTTMAPQPFLYHWVTKACPCSVTSGSQS